MNKRSIRMNGEFIFPKCDESTRADYISVIEELREEFPVTRSCDSYFSEDLMNHGIQLEMYYILEKALEAESMYDGCQGPIMGVVIDGEEGKFKLSIHQSGLYEPERWKKVMDLITPILLKGTCINFFSSDSGHHWRIISKEDGSWKLEEGEITFR